MKGKFRRACRHWKPLSQKEIRVGHHSANQRQTFLEVERDLDNYMCKICKAIDSMFHVENGIRRVLDLCLE
jgi:hypothetical protein